MDISSIGLEIVLNLKNIKLMSTIGAIALMHEDDTLTSVKVL